MNNGLDFVHIINTSDLSESEYFQSLMEQALYKGLIADVEIERIQLECIALLADKVNRYNLGDSSSIPVDKAKDIMNSIFFTIGLQLKTYGNPDSALASLQKYKISEIYEKGFKRINTLTLSAKTLHDKLLKQLLFTPNVYYSATIKDGVLGFFKLYYPEFSADEIHITADYPLFNQRPKLLGIEFIKNYIECAYYENKFCSYFTPENIHFLLSGFDKNYNELLFNIYEPVLSAALACVILDRSVYDLNIGEQGVKLLHDILSGQRDNISLIIMEAFYKSDKILSFSEGLNSYIKKSLPLITERIRFSLLNNTLDTIFFVPKYPERKQKILFSFGDKMDDKLYRKVLEEINSCRFFEDKIAIIKENIRSLADLEDILLDALLSNEETQIILNGLDLTETAALLKKYPLLNDFDMADLSDKEIFLTRNLHYFLNNLQKERRDFVNEMAANIEL